MSGSSEMLRDFNAPNRLKLGWMGPKSVVTYDAATGGVEDWAGASLPGTAFVSALNLGPAIERHLLLKIPCPTCTSARDHYSHNDGNVYVSFRGDNAAAAGSTYGVGNTGSGINTFEGGACTNRNLKLVTNRVHVHYQRTGGIPSELWTMLSEGESYEIDGAALAIHVCTVGTEAEGRRALSDPVCIDLDGTANDTYDNGCKHGNTLYCDTEGYGCSGYSNPVFCDYTYLDDTDFSSSTMCCSCGGGAPVISELNAMVTVGTDLMAAKALCTTPWPPAMPPAPPAPPPSPAPPPPPPSPSPPPPLPPPSPPPPNCGSLSDETACKISKKKIKKCKKEWPLFTYTMEPCKKQCKKDREKKQRCQKTCCKLGFPI